MTVFPQPKAPGIAVVPPWTQLDTTYLFQRFVTNHLRKSLTEIRHPGCVDQLEVGDPPSVSQPRDEAHGRAKAASSYAWKFSPRIRIPARRPIGKNTRSISLSKVCEQNIYIDRITAFLCDMGDRSKSAG